MIDLHAHILPGLDDGPACLDEALDIAQAAWKDGVRQIVATPHHCDGMYHNPRKRILVAVSKLIEALKEAGIPIKILPGAEIHLQPDLADLIKTDTILTLNDEGRVLLIELPQTSVPPTLSQILFQLRLLEITPVLAHPERNTIMQQEPERLSTWVEGGGLVQITVASLLGESGIPARKTAELFLSSGWVHILASDSHGAGMRPGLKDGYRRIKRLYGPELAQKLTHTNPASLLDGRTVNPQETRPPRKRRWLW